MEKNNERELYTCMNELEDEIHSIHRERKKGKEINSKQLEMLWWEMDDVKDAINMLINNPDEYENR